MPYELNFPQKDTDKPGEDPALEEDLIAGNEAIDGAITALYAEPDTGHLNALMETIRERMDQGAELMVAVEFPQMKYQTFQDPDGAPVLAAFTTLDQSAKEPVAGAQYRMDKFFRQVVAMEEIAGVVLNPFGEPFTLTKTLLQKMIEYDDRIAASGGPAGNP